MITNLLEGLECRKFKENSVKNMNTNVKGERSKRDFTVSLRLTVEVLIYKYVSIERKFS